MVVVRMLVAVGLLLGADVASASSLALPSTTLDDYAVLGLEDVILRGGVAVDAGDVGCTNNTNVAGYSLRSSHV